jgi:trans-aconitate methyltransferase
MNRVDHWAGVYARNRERSVSWFEPTPNCSLELLGVAGARPELPFIDVGAGASNLVDHLLRRGYADVTVLDVTEAGLASSRRRLGQDASDVRWIVADLLAWTPERRYSTWHDRAAFHFLTEPDDQRRYRDVLARSLAPEAVVVIGTFAEDGPRHCSGLPTAGYTAAQLAAALGTDLREVARRRAEHQTPDGRIQPFTWLALRRGAEPPP